MKVLKGIICLILSGEWLGDDEAYPVERAADPLPVPGLTPNLAAILRTPGLPGVARVSRIRFSSVRAIGRPAKPK
jgi:hypothetical protein